MTSKAQSIDVVRPLPRGSLGPTQTLIFNGFQLLRSKSASDVILIVLFRVVHDQYPSYATHHLLKIHVKESIHNQFVADKADFVKCYFNASLKHLIKVARTGSIPGEIRVPLSATTLKAWGGRESAQMLDPAIAEIEL
jgi:hypothetical protein